MRRGEDEKEENKEDKYEDLSKKPKRVDQSCGNARLAAARREASWKRAEVDATHGIGQGGAPAPQRASSRAEVRSTCNVSPLCSFLALWTA